jgi:hypothetical protein
MYLKVVTSSGIYFYGCQESPDVPEGGGQVQRMVCFRLRYSQSTAVHHASRLKGKKHPFAFPAVIIRDCSSFWA